MIGESTRTAISPPTRGGGRDPRPLAGSQGCISAPERGRRTVATGEAERGAASRNGTRGLRKSLPAPEGQRKAAFAAHAPPLQGGRKGEGASRPTGSVPIVIGTLPVATIHDPSGVRRLICRGAELRHCTDRDRRDSIEDVLPVEFHAVCAKKREEFTGIVTLLVMLHLVLNVRRHIGLSRLADGEDRITLLPRKRLECGKRLVDSQRRSRLDRANQVRDRAVCSPTQESVNVVRHAADGEGNTSFRADDSSNVLVEAVLDRRFDHRGATLGRENDMEENLRVGAGHQSSSASLRGRKVSSPPPRGGGGLLPRVKRSEAQPRATEPVDCGPS